MNLIAVSRGEAHREAVDRTLGAVLEYQWAEGLESATLCQQAKPAQVLLLVAEQWPDNEIDSLIQFFGPRPVVLLDLSANGDWYGAQLPACVQLASLGELNGVVSRLVDLNPATPPARLALLSPRNDYDGALLAIYVAWTLREQAESVLIVDLALPRADVADYLDVRPEVSFYDVVEHSDDLDQGWLDQYSLAATGGIDVLVARREGSVGRLNGEALHRSLAWLEQKYDHLLFNMVGVQGSALLDQIAGRCDQQWILSDQKNVSLGSAVALAERVLERGARPGGVNLVLAPFDREVLPGREAIAAHIKLPVRGCLPWHGRALSHINAGQLLPPPPELQALRRAVADTLALRVERSWWQRLAWKRAS